MLLAVTAVSPSTVWPKIVRGDYIKHLRKLWT